MEYQFSNSMKDIFLKKYWGEGDILFYLHFLNGEAIRQIEITSKSKVYLSAEKPTENGFMLYDQSLDDLDVEESDFITKEEFDKVWDER